MGNYAPTINFAEVQLFNEGAQIPPSALIFSFISNTGETHSAKDCNDGSLTSFCQIRKTSDSIPTLVITSPYPVDEIVLYNRLASDMIVMTEYNDICRHCAVGASITVSIGGLILWKSTVKTNADVYLISQKDDERLQGYTKI